MRDQRHTGVLRGMAVLVIFSMAGMQAARAQHEQHDQHQQHEMPPDTSQPAPPPRTPEDDQTSSEARHVPPDPPAHEIADMSYPAMAAMMQMDDTDRFGKVLVDQAEWRDAGDGNASVWDAQAFYGSDYNKLFLKTEGERTQGKTEDARAELLWDRIVTRWWSLQGGVREDFGEGPSRTWAALGVEGLAPYRFDVEATFYVGEEGRTAARVKSEYDLLLTQRLILQPEIEANLYGKADPARALGSGLSDLDVGLRLRYEIRREFAPYLGIAWRRLFGDTARFSRALGGGRSDVQAVAGLRVWF